MSELGNGQACAEVLQVLQYIPKEDYEKIPKAFLNELKWNAKETDFKYNAGLPFAEQGISAEAKEILRDIANQWWTE